ncbi:MAG: VWA domain-containing protein, partial [Eudoraea sp.]
MFILVINPKFIKDSYVLEKTNLVILADNSSSIKNAGASEELSNTLGYLLESRDLNDKFEVSSYIFGNEINTEDTLSFDDPLTNIGKALTTVNNIHGGENTALLV